MRPSDPDLYRGREISPPDWQGECHRRFEQCGQACRPAYIALDEQANELYVADGYTNRRVIVLDAKSGAYKRHWGAYGKKPSDDKMPAYKPDAPLSEQFSNPVHCVRLSNDFGRRAQKFRRIE